MPARAGGDVLNFLRSHLSPLLSLSVRALSVLAGFAIAFFIGHELGPAANGHYAVITQTATLLAALATGGFDLAIVREYAAAIPGLKPISRGDILKVFALIAAVSGAIVVVLTVVVLVLGLGIYDEISTANALALLAAIFVTRALGRIGSAFLRAQQQFVLSQGIELLFVPLAVLALVLIHMPPSTDTILLWTAAAGVAVGLAGIAINLALATRAADGFSLPIGRLVKTALPLCGVTLTLNFADWYSLSVVAWTQGIAEAGIYRVSMQFGMMLWIVSAGLYSVFGTRISAAFAAQDREAVARICRSAMQLALLLIVPAAAVLILAAPEILLLIGPEFSGGAPIIRIVALGQVLIAVTGVAGIALIMAGHARLNFIITAAGLAAMLVLAPLGAWLMGPVGVAACVTAITVAMNAANAGALYRVSGINAITGKVAPSLA